MKPEQPVIFSVLTEVCPKFSSLATGLTGLTEMDHCRRKEGGNISFLSAHRNSLASSAATLTDIQHFGFRLCPTHTQAAAQISFKYAPALPLISLSVAMTTDKLCSSSSAAHKHTPASTRVSRSGNLLP